MNNTLSFAPDTTIYDRDQFLDRLLGDEELAQTIISLFVEDIPQQIAEVEKSIHQENTLTTADLVHKIKGAAANVSGHRLYQVAGAMETAARSAEIDQLTAHMPQHRDRHKNSVCFPPPGNVRELANTLEHAVVFCQERTISPEHLPDQLRCAAPRDFSLTLHDSSLEAAETALICSVLQQQNWHLTKAAAALGIARGTLYSKMEKLGIVKPGFPLENEK